MDADRVLHRLGVGLGVVVLGVGVGLLFAPATASILPIPFGVADVAAIGAAILGLWILRTRYRAAHPDTEVPAVEYRLSTPAPGDDLDALIHRLTERREGTIEYRDRIQNRVAELAVSAITARHDCSREEAIDRLEAGTWSDNAAATGFFTGRSGADAPSLLEELRSRFSRTEDPYRRQLRETIAEVEAVSGIDLPHADASARVPEAATDGPPARGRSRSGRLGADDGDRVSGRRRDRSSQDTHHWTGITGFALLALAVGIVTSQPSLLVASAVGVGLAGYARAVAPPRVGELEITRSVGDETPEPGDEVVITVTVENTGDTVLPDLRLVDRIPPTMRVVDGSARLGTALRPGSTATFSYTVTVERGTHEWPLQVLSRDAAGDVEREALFDVGPAVRCAPDLETTTEMPVRMLTSVYAGIVETDIGGEGLEFHATRDYHPDDPERRIDWNTYARNRELSTVEYRKEQAARVVLLFDAREAAYVSRDPGANHALDMAIDASFDVYASLHDQGHLVGVAAFDGIPCWLAPDTGTLHRERVRQLFVDHPALSPLPPDLAAESPGRYVDPMTHVRRQLPANTQVVLFSPLTDEYAAEVVRRLDGAGHRVSVISPDPTTSRTLGQRITRLERAMHVREVREQGIRVVDWNPDDRLALELEHAARRWTA